MSRSLSRLVVVLAVFGAMLVLLFASGQRQKPAQQPAPERAAEPEPKLIDVAPEPSAPFWNASGQPVAGLSPDAELMKWQTAAPPLSAAPAIAGISADGRFLATVQVWERWEYEQSGLFIWDLQTGARRRVPTKNPGHPYWVNVGFAPDNKSFAVRFGGHLSVWDMTADKLKAELATGDWREAWRQPVFTPDGAAVALGGTGLLVFDGNAKKQRPFGEPAVAKGFGYSVPAWSPNGRWLAAVTESTSHLCVWDADSCEVAWKSPELQYGYGTSVAFTADSKRAIAVNWRDGAVSEWDIATKKKIREAKVQAGNAGAISDDGSRFAWLAPAESESGYTPVVVADVDGKELHRVHPRAVVNGYRLSGNGKRLVVTGFDGSLRIYNTDDGTLVQPISEGWSPARHIAHRDGGKVIRIVHDDGTIREQDAETRMPLRLTRLDLPKDEHLVTVSPDGRLWATVTNDGAVRVWDIATGRPRLHCAEQVPIPQRWIDYGRFRPPGSPDSVPDYRAVALNFAADGRYLIGATAEGKAITVWDVASGRTVHTIATPDRVTSFVMSPDGKTLFAAGDPNQGMRLYPQVVRAWDVDSGRQVWERAFRSLQASADRPSWSAIRGVHLFRNGDALAVVVTEYTSGPGMTRGGPSETHRVWVVPRRTSEQMRSYLVHEPLAVAFSGDGRWLASGTTRVCDLETGKRYGPIHNQAYYDPRYNAVGAAFHPNGKLVAIATPEWAGAFDVEKFRAEAEKKRKEQRELGYDPPDKD